MKRIAISAITTAALVLGTGVAHADPADDQFLTAVNAQGIPGDPAQLIAEGHAACANYGGPALAAQAMRLMSQGMSNVQASNLQLDGIHAYCREKVPF